MDKFDCSKAKESGLCKHSDCCGIVGIPAETYKKYYQLVSEKVNELSDKIEIDNMIYPLTKSGYCIFLNEDSMQCIIYDERPQVCKDFGVKTNQSLLLTCPYLKPNGNLWSKAKQRRLSRIVGRVIETSLKSHSKKQSEN